MRYLLKYLIVILIITGCAQGEESTRPDIKSLETKPLIVQEEDGKYTEWYPGHQQIKLTGRKTPDGKRTGIWKYYSEQGVELSITVYTDGEKDGHIVVRHPNGALYYVGEFNMGNPVGEWKFYNEQGELTETKNYSE